MWWPFSSKKKKEEVKHMAASAHTEPVTNDYGYTLEKSSKPGTVKRSRYHKCRRCGKKFFGQHYRPTCCGYLTGEEWGFFDIYLNYLMIEMLMGDSGYDTNTYVEEDLSDHRALESWSDREASLSSSSIPEPVVESKVERSWVETTREIPSFESHSSYDSGGSSGGCDCGGGGCDCGGGGGD